MQLLTYKEIVRRMEELMNASNLKKDEQLELELILDRIDEYNHQQKERKD